MSCPRCSPRPGQGHRVELCADCAKSVREQFGGDEPPTDPGPPTQRSPLADTLPPEDGVMRDGAATGLDDWTEDTTVDAERKRS